MNKCIMLVANKVSNVLWKTKELENTWSYYPEQNVKFHKIINIGKFFASNKNYAITEVIGDVSYMRVGN